RIRVPLVLPLTCFPHPSPPLPPLRLSRKLFRVRLLRAALLRIAAEVGLPGRAVGILVVSRAGAAGLHHARRPAADTPKPRQQVHARVSIALLLAIPTFPQISTALPTQYY